MPCPSSATEIRLAPPSRASTSTREAPASIAFSTSSLTAAAGLSTTSPAAIWLTSTSGKRLIGITLYNPEQAADKRAKEARSVREKASRPCGNARARHQAETPEMPCPSDLGIIELNEKLKLLLYRM